MNSRDLVRNTLEMNHPPRIPRQLWLLPWAESRYPEQVVRLRREFPDDLVTAPRPCLPPVPDLGDRYRQGIYVDEWGCTFESAEAGTIGLVRKPLIHDWSDLDRLREPWAWAKLDTDAINSFCRAEDRFVLGGSWIRPFERLQFIRTMENALMDVMEQRSEFLQLLRRIHQYYLAEAEAWAATEVDAIAIMDDWGCQQSLLIPPDLWRQLFKPLYREYAEIAHRKGKFVFMHSDGHIFEILDDLIEVGIDAVNAQIFCMGIDALGQRYRGRITFWGEIDRQYLLAYGTQEQVREAVVSVYSSLYAGGGVIAQCEFGPGAKPENIHCVFSSWDILHEHRRKERV
jgi:uroporphyrinogen decarboxylase